MAYKITNWIGSEWKDEERARLEPGEYDLYIRSARYDEQSNRYSIVLEDVQTGAEASFSWYTVTRNGDLNRMSVGTLSSLGKALFGENIGVPFFEDIVGGVVHAKVEPGKPYTKQTGEVVQYPQIFRFDPVRKSIHELAAS